MARIRIFIVLALALTAGGALAFATYNYVQSQGARPVALLSQAASTAIR